MTTRHPRLILWTGDEGVAPDRTRYLLNSEQVRPEPRMWWAMAWDDGRLVDVFAIHEDGWPTKDRAKQDAEAHYRRKINGTEEERDQPHVRATPAPPVPVVHEMTLTYTRDDDGIHLECSCGADSVLGFSPSPDDVARAAKTHTKETR